MVLKAVVCPPGGRLLLVKDHIYRMVIVEGRRTMARSSSLGANCSLVDTKVSSDWSDTMVWFGQILLYLSFTILYI